jgi:hypothetical protein
MALFPNNSKTHFQVVLTPAETALRASQPCAKTVLATQQQADMAKKWVRSRSWYLPTKDWRCCGSSPNSILALFQPP